jgi:putative aminopeptidase FrvX
MKLNEYIDNDSYSFLKKYLNNSSPVGDEMEGQKIWLTYIKKYVNFCHSDSYGNSYGIINKDSRFKVVIEAHADEISWKVNYINENGLIYCKANGDIDHQIAPSMRVNIYGKKGIVKGIFGWPAIHTRYYQNNLNDSNIIPEILFIDCGAKNKKEVEKLGIHVGAFITYDVGYDELANSRIIGRGLDNKIGGFIIAEVAKLIFINMKKINFGLYIVNAVQEEIGHKGAEIIAKRINPNIAIVTDVIHDTNTPMIKKELEGDISIGLGPVLTHGPSIHQKLNQQIIRCAKNNKIDIQYTTSSWSTGTDTEAFAYSNLGCPSALISLPLKYMHTTVEMADKKDILNTINLIYNSLLELEIK